MMAIRWIVRNAGPMALLAGIYYLLAAFSIKFQFTGTDIVLFWPATGVALAAMLMWGSHLWPAVAVGIFLAEFNLVPTHQSIPGALCITFGNTISLVVASHLLTNLKCIDLGLGKIRDVVHLITIGALLNSAISATIGVVTLYLLGFVNGPRFMIVWLKWWAAYGLGILITTPLLLAWANRLQERRLKARFIEAATLGASNVGLCFLLFLSPRVPTLYAYTLIFAIQPLFFWAAIRFGQVGVTTSIFITSALAAYGSYRGIGAFSEGTTAELMTFFSLFIATVSCVGLMVAAVTSERRRASRLVAESETRFRQLAENIKDVFWLRSVEDHQVLYVSPAYESVWGRTPESLYNDSRQWWISIHPEDRERVKRTVFDPQSQGKFDSEYRITLPDGQERWVHDCGFPVRNELGNIYRMAGIARDITLQKNAELELKALSEELELRVMERTVELFNANSRLEREIQEHGEVDEALRESEERFRRLYEAAFEGLLFHQQGTILDANQVLATMFGYERDELVGKSRFLLLADEAVPQVRRILSSKSWTESNSSIETTGIRKDGTKFPIEMQSKSIPYYGRTMSVMAIRDLTQRKRSEETSSQHQEELAHVLRLSTMGEMAAGLAHELNQPLAAIVNYAQGSVRRLRSPSPDTNAVIEAIENASGQAQRAGQIIRRMRDMICKREPRSENADLLKVIRDAGELVKAEARRNGVELIFNCDVGAPMACVDSIQIEQVIINLVRNAMEASRKMPRDRRIVRLELTRHDDKELRVDVIDRGIGLSKAGSVHLFDPFFSTKMNGMGMGLTISRSIVESHGGRMWGQNNEHGGATITFTLPAVELGVELCC